MIIGILLGLLSLCSVSFAANVPIQVFNLSAYSQKVSTYIDPNSSTYNTPLISRGMQSGYLRNLLSHSVGVNSPWSKQFEEANLKTFMETYLKSTKLKEAEQKMLDSINNHVLTGDNKVYQENFRLLSQKMFLKVEQNVFLKQFNQEEKYQTSKRAIITNATIGYTLPISSPLYLHFTLPGQGFPFSVTAASSLNIGTAVYVLGESRDKAWKLVQTSSYIAWISARDVAYISQQNIKIWRNALSKNRLSVTHFNTSIIDNNQRFITTAYPDTLLPVLKQDRNSFTVLLPIKTAEGQLRLQRGYISNENAVKVPLLATPHNFAKVINATKGYPYGWGDTFFYTDCSAELRAVYQTFGIWLPRNSTEQSKTYRTINLDNASPGERIQSLLKYGKPLMTFVHINGHIFLYIGKGRNPHNPTETVPIIFQQIWGLHDKEGTFRDVIGKASFLPLLSVYPQNPKIVNEATKPIFEMSFAGIKK